MTGSGPEISAATKTFMKAVGDCCEQRAYTLSDRLVRIMYNCPLPSEDATESLLLEEASLPTTDPIEGLTLLTGVQAAPST